MGELVASGGGIHGMARFRHTSAPHDTEDREPLGPLTPDDQSAAGDTPEVHDEITPHDLPKDHPGRAAAVRAARLSGGVTQGNV